MLASQCTMLITSVTEKNTSTKLCPTLLHLVHYWSMALQFEQLHFLSFKLIIWPATSYNQIWYIRNCLFTTSYKDMVINYSLCNPLAEVCSFLQTYDIPDIGDILFGWSCERPFFGCLNVPFSTFYFGFFWCVFPVTLIVELPLDWVALVKCCCCSALMLFINSYIQHCNKCTCLLKCHMFVEIDVVSDGVTSVQ